MRRLPGAGPSHGPEGSCLEPAPFAPGGAPNGFLSVVLAEQFIGLLSAVSIHSGTTEGALEPLQANAFHCGSLLIASSVERAAGSAAFLAEVILSAKTMPLHAHCAHIPTRQTAQATRAQNASCTPIRKSLSMTMPGWLSRHLRPASCASRVLSVMRS